MKPDARIAISNDLLLPEIREWISQGHTVTLSVRGNSMNPFLADRRDKVRIAPLSGKPQTGELLLAYEKARQRYVLHRLLRIQDNEYILMGDGNLKGTETIREEDLIGTVTHVIRKGKTHSTSSFCWKFYSALWLRLLPVRRWLLAVWRRI